jgi:3',5'-cyclic-AMP phosphodiesterase
LITTTSFSTEDGGVEEPRYTLIQISDLHVEEAGVDSRYGLDTTTLLAGALRRVETTGVRPDAVLLTGDLVERGTPEEYRRLRDLVEPVAARLAVPFVYAMGNHDDRAALRGVLLGDGSGSTDPLYQVIRLHGLRIVVLDSSVPGVAFGDLTDDQLDRLRADLAEPAPDGTVLVLHHPPLPSVVPIAGAIELLHPQRLADAVARSDVRIVLAGHTHMTSAGTLAGIPVWTAGALASTADTLAPAGSGSRLVRTPTIGRIDLFADSLIATAVPVEAPVIAEFDLEQTAATVARLDAAVAAHRS